MTPTTTPHQLISIPQALVEVGQTSAVAADVLRARIHARVGTTITTLSAWAEALVPDVDLWQVGLPAALAQVPEPGRSSIARQLALNAVMRAYKPEFFAHNPDFRERVENLIAEYIGPMALGLDPLNAAEHQYFWAMLEIHAHWMSAGYLDARRFGCVLFTVREILPGWRSTDQFQQVLRYTFQVRTAVSRPPAWTNSAYEQMWVTAGIQEVRDQLADLQAILTSGS